MRAEKLSGYEELKLGDAWLAPGRRAFGTFVLKI